MSTFDFGMVGLGVMGRNFLLNVADHGFGAAGLDIDAEKVVALEQEGAGKKVKGTTDMATFVGLLEKPRIIMLLVPAGNAVDKVMDSLKPHLDKGDIIIDGGNSHFADTERRQASMADSGFGFLGVGVSGGEKGARFGPSIMPGGDTTSYERVKPIFEAVSAKVNGEPCVDYMGASSAGHYVKMVHNGIEYGIMQMISESYDILVKIGGLTTQDLQSVFSSWNEGRLGSFLMEITSHIVYKHDDQPGEEGYLLDKVLDKAKQKGTGKWTSQHAMDLGAPIPTIDASVTMRGLSAQKSFRLQADAAYDRAAVLPDSIDAAEVIKLAEATLYFSYIVSYAQGLSLLRQASAEKEFGVDMARIAKIWRGGCIIRAKLLEPIRQAFSDNPDLENLLMAPSIIEEIQAALPSVRKCIALAVQAGVPVMCLSSSLAYFDSLTSGRLPLNMVQAQRDYFGAHTYERIDREGVFHSRWAI